MENSRLLAAYLLSHYITKAAAAKRAGESRDGRWDGRGAASASGMGRRATRRVSSSSAVQRGTYALSWKELPRPVQDLFLVVPAPQVREHKQSDVTSQAALLDDLRGSPARAARPP